MRRLLTWLRRRRETPAPPVDRDRLLKIYAETLAEVQRLRRAA